MQHVVLQRIKMHAKNSSPNVLHEMRVLMTCSSICSGGNGGAIPMFRVFEGGDGGGTFLGNVTYIISAPSPISSANGFVTISYS